MTSLFWTPRIRDNLSPRFEKPRSDQGRMAFRGPQVLHHIVEALKVPLAGNTAIAIPQVTHEGSLKSSTGTNNFQSDGILLSKMIDISSQRWVQKTHLIDKLKSSLSVPSFEQT